MADRDALLRDRLDLWGWGDAIRHPLAGDASNRRYLRLQCDRTGQTAVLMDAPPARGEDVRPFLRIARHLDTLGLSAPAILAEDPETGFLLLEDLGDALFARVLRQDPTLEGPLYEAATDLLANLHEHPTPKDIAVYDTETMTRMADMAFQFYVTGITGRDSEHRRAALNTLRALLADHADRHDVLILRDYHAENLIWLPERDGLARVGLLDFQDATRGHRAYDLVSILQDARRDVPLKVETAMITRYCTTTQVDPASFEIAYRILGAQRNLRILGIFARLCIHNGKPGYLDLMPRVWSLLWRDLSHPALAPLADLCETTLPEPTPDSLARLRRSGE